MREMKMCIRFVMTAAILILLTIACSSTTAEPTATPTEPAGGGMENMSGGSMSMDSPQSTQQYAPLVRGIYEGGEVLFIHTEASDPEVASMLTEMMAGPEVVLVPALADAPTALVAQVYVFTNGVVGHGPFGFQADIFDAVPGDGAYRPLRNVNLVSWQESATPREVCSVVEVQAAEANGEITITQPGIVVNMPVLVWPGGHVNGDYPGNVQHQGEFKGDAQVSLVCYGVCRPARPPSVRCRTINSRKTRPMLPSSTYSLQGVPVVEPWSGSTPVSLLALGWEGRSAMCGSPLLPIVVKRCGGIGGDT